MGLKFVFRSLYIFDFFFFKFQTHVAITAQSPVVWVSLINKKIH